jgi:pimeloyl-ACP methyl ester carboxylesterase
MGAFGEDVAAVVKQLGIKKAVLIGHSMGTPVILEAAQRFPQETVALIPVDMLHNVESTYAEGQIEDMAEEFMASLNNPTHESLEIWFRPSVDPTLVDAYIEYCNSVSQVGWEESLREVLAWVSNDQLEVLQETTAPVHCINADRPVTDVEMARKYVRPFDVTVIAGVGHSIHWEVPNEFNRVLEEVLSTINP